MNKINMDEAKILLDCKHLVTHLKEINEATRKMRKVPDESLLAFYLQVFNNLEVLKDSCIKGAINVSERANWWNKKVAHNLIKDITHHFSHIERDLNTLQTNINKS